MFCTDYYFLLKVLFHIFIMNLQYYWIFSLGAETKLIRPNYSAPSLSRDRRIKMHQSINQSTTNSANNYSKACMHQCKLT